MESSGCYLVLFLILGATVGALLAEGNARRRAGLGKIKFYRTEKERWQKIRKKSRGSRTSGYTDLLTSVLLMVIGLFLLAVIIYALFGF
jgi:hypothetical protein